MGVEECGEEECGECNEWEFWNCACAPILLHIHRNFEVNRTKIKEGCQLIRKRWAGVNFAAHSP